MKVKNKHLERQVAGSHYQKLKIQCMEFCLANMSSEELRGILKFNVLKYTWRDKENPMEDLDKAVHYIEMIKEELNNRDIPVPVTDEIIPDRREQPTKSNVLSAQMKQLWNFPITRFAKENDIHKQLLHMASEAQEFLDAYNGTGDLEGMLDEATDFIHSFHTLTNIKGCERLARESQERVEVKNNLRNYYL